MPSMAHGWLGKMPSVCALVVDYPNDSTHVELPPAAPPCHQFLGVKRVCGWMVGSKSGQDHGARKDRSMAQPDSFAYVRACPGEGETTGAVGTFSLRAGRIPRG